MSTVATIRIGAIYKIVERIAAFLKSGYNVWGGGASAGFHPRGYVVSYLSTDEYDNTESHEQLFSTAEQAAKFYLYCICGDATVTVTVDPKMREYFGDTNQRVPEFKYDIVLR